MKFSSQGQVCVLSGWRMGGFMGEVLSSFGTRGSSLIISGIASL